MITYSEEKIIDIMLDLDPLIRQHMKEINYLGRQGVEPRIDYNQYMRMQAVDGMTFITCRKDKKLIGYISITFGYGLRFMDHKKAMEDMYYIVPEQRGNGYGRQLFEEAERIVRERGFDNIVLTSKVYQDHSKLFENLGYEFFEKHFIKRLNYE